MKKIKLQFLALLSSIVLLNAAAFAEPNNLSLLRNAVKTYHDSGQYEKELTKTILAAQNYILRQAELNEHCCKDSKKLAIVLDIDETSLSNYNKLVNRDFVVNREQIHQEILAANSPVIAPMLVLYNKARKQGIKVFFVTGRHQSELAATKVNLLHAGYKNWAGLYLRPNNYKETSIIPFKSQARKLIAAQGYTIIASIGDQYSDIKGGYFQKGFKLPNPFYYLP